MKTSVRFLAVLFALIIAMFTLAYAADYSDVAPSNANYDAIELLSTLGVLHGYDDGTFRPNEPVQRDEMAKMIYIMATAFEDAGEGVKLFPDVSEKHWASGFITWAHTKKIVGGYEDGTFRPDDNITYDEALKMATAMLGYTDFDPELWPSDVRLVALKQLGLGENIEETVVGDTVITRAQAAQIIYNAFYKTMATTKTISYYKTGFYEEDGTTPASREVLVEVPMTLAADVWDCDVYNYKIVATQTFAVNDVAKNLKDNSCTGKEDEIKVVTLKADGTYESYLFDDKGNTDPTDDEYKAVVETLNIEDLGLNEYVGKTDDIIGFTVSKIVKDGEDFALSGIKGARYSGVPVNHIIAKSTDSSTWHEGSTYWFSGRIKIDGTVYEGDNFWNLRAVYVDTASTTDPVFNVMDKPIAFDKQFNGAWETPIGTFYPDPSAERKYKDREVHFNSYFLGYYNTAWTIDSEGDGVVDYIFLKNVQPFKVTNVIDIVNNGVKDQRIEVVDIYNVKSTYTFLKSNINYEGEFKKGDIFVGANYGNRLYVDSIVEPVTSYITAINASNITVNGIGKVNLGANFVPWPASTVRANIFDVSNPQYWINKKADGTYNKLTLWIYKDSVIWTSANVADKKTSYDKAILLYVDPKTDEQLDKSTNKFVTFYPAYLLINGKEEAVNLNPKTAIDGLSGEYVSADGSPYRATTNDDGTLGTRNYLVTYEKDDNGYYILKQINSDLKDEEDNLLEKIIPESDYPVLQYNNNTGLFKIVTYSENPATVENPAVKETYHLVDVSKDTYLYYKYYKESTGDYQYIGFYTSDNIKGKFDEVAFASDVYLTYNEDDGFYTLHSALLSEEIEIFDGDTPTVSVEKDGRVIYMAVENSAYVKNEDEVCYEHYLMNPATGELITVVQDKKTVAEHALALEAGKFYAWDASSDDYVRVTAEGVTAVATLKKFTIDRIDSARDIVYTTTGEYSDGIKLTDIPVVAFDNDLNRNELNVSDIEQFKDIFDEKNTDTMDIVFVTYEDVNGDVQIAYAITDYAEIVEKTDGTREPVIHTDVTNLLIGQ